MCRCKNIQVDVSNQKLFPEMFELQFEWSDLHCMLQNKENPTIKPTMASFFVGDKARALKPFTKLGIQASATKIGGKQDGIGEVDQMGGDNTILQTAADNKKQTLLAARKAKSLAANTKQATPMTITIDLGKSKKRLLEKTPGPTVEIPDPKLVRVE